MPHLTSMSSNHLFALCLHPHLVITKVLHLTVVTGHHSSRILPAPAAVSQILEVPFSSSNFNYSFASCLTAPTHFAVSNAACKWAALCDPPSCLIGTSLLNNFPECHRQEGMCHACLGVSQAPKANVSESHTFPDRKIFWPMKNVTCLLFCRQGSIGLNILCGDDVPLPCIALNLARLHVMSTQVWFEKRKEHVCIDFGLCVCF